MTKELTSTQRNKIAEQFAELVVDGMDTKDLVRYVFADMMDHFVSLTADELEDAVNEQIGQAEAYYENQIADYYTY